MTEITEAKRLVLADAERRRSELDTLITALRRELGMAADEPAVPETGSAGQQTSTAPVKVEDVVTPGDFFGMTQVGAAKEFLQRLNKRTATLNEIGAALFRGKAITAALNEKGLKNLSSVLSRSDEFLSVAKGRWGLSEWYPNRAKKARNNGTDGAPQNKEVGEEKPA